MISTETQRRFGLGLVGPVFPFRGGIARHTTELRMALEPLCRVPTVSFRRMYPAWLYPGAMCIEPGYEGRFDAGTDYMLDPLNPLTWIRGTRRLLDQAVGAVVFQWWTVFMAPCAGFMAASLKRRGVEPIFLCHNFQDHETAGWKGALAARALSPSGRFLTHSNEEALLLRRAFPSSSVVFYPHPIFETVPAPRRTLPRRARMELLFFGLVRPYKGLDVLIDAMSLLRDADVFLTVAGEWWMKDNALRERMRGLRRVEMMDRYVSEDEAADLFARADAVVLPYRRATGTGVIPLAYRYGKPVVATRSGGLPDIVDDGLSGFLVEAGNASALAGAIRRLFDALPLPPAGLEAVTRRMTFDGLARALIALAGRAAQGAAA